ncbi:unnamed protein product [Periconia digitata]|uniref:Uncharacterized protein n=1 Tax=Periconia digitata TaxID=1303443 RepID=A0A9W4XQX8_9PLEO|nr:unnamed protein product [Periconia digitata]
MAMFRGRPTTFLSFLQSCFLIFIIIAVIVPEVAGSDITTYVDGNCQTSFNNLDVVNGYPDGVCTKLPLSPNGTPQSFQVVKLDPECAVTIYGANESPLTCSSSLKIVAELGACYNATWQYYSVDGCTSPKSTSITPPIISQTFTVPPSSPTTTSTSSTTPSPPAAAPTNDAAPSTPSRAIIGGITGGVASIAVASALIFLLILRRRRNRRNGTPDRNKPLPKAPTFELPNDGALVEAAHCEVQVPRKVAVWGAGGEQIAAVEIGRNSAFELRMERERMGMGREWKGMDEKGGEGREVKGWNMI